jgi:hypothetical protein
MRVTIDPTSTADSDIRWFKSSRSGGAKECVEVAFLDQDIVAVRDSKDPSGPALRFSPAEWDSFTDTIHRAIFDQRS